MRILNEATPTSPKFMIFGLAGSGKTTLASKLKNSLIIDIEGGANYVDTPRTEQITTLEDFYTVLTMIYKGEKNYDYIVIDTADWLARLIIEQVAGIDRKHLDNTLNKSNGGYGAGRQIMDNHIRTKLLPMLTAMNKKGYGICLLAHADKKDLMDSDGTNIEQITPKIDANTMNVFVEWCDGVFYLKKDANGKRTLLLDADDVALAKNRQGLSGSVDLDKVDINDVLTNKLKEEK